jgi:hypothetical protein
MIRVKALLVFFCGIIVCAFMCSCFPPPEMNFFGSGCNNGRASSDDQTIGEYFGISSHPAPALRRLSNTDIVFPAREAEYLQIQKSALRWIISANELEAKYLEFRGPELRRIVLGRANVREELSLWIDLARPRVPFSKFGVDRKLAIDRLSHGVASWLKDCEKEILVADFNFKELDASKDQLTRDFQRYIHWTDYRADLFINFVRARGAIESRLAERCHEKLSNLPEDPYDPANRYQSPRDIGDQCLQYFNGMSRQFTTLTILNIERAVVQAYQRFYMHQLADLRAGHYEYPESLKQLELLGDLMRRANVPKDLRPSDAEWAQLSRRSLPSSTE